METIAQIVRIEIFRLGKPLEQLVVEKKLSMHNAIAVHGTVLDEIRNSSVRLCIPFLIKGNYKN